jgi:hypothetical protein
MEFPQKKKQLKLNLAYDPAVLFLCVYPRTMKSAYQRDTCMLMFIVALFTIAKVWNQARCASMDDWIKKM